MEVKNEATELVDKLQASPEPAQQLEQNDFQEIPEISPELAAMQNGDFVPENLDGAQDPQQSATNDKAKLTEAETMALNALAPLFGTIQGLTGRSYNLDENAAKKLAQGVAPCLVKYGLVDPSRFFEKWGAEIQAGVAIGSVLFGAYGAHKQYKAEDAKAAADAEKAESKEAA
ncbi:hypothetical protein [Shewanella fidelis]|uniref:Uncharacterized protein n=1 Tax=Shewanella fidelis TaxID=173509 RepID=A0AAW8NPK7_9GAMM|nr:hypothetical protein [Shewanella fidelis]MDR8523848.1 hypothetical protein [Shewanella fidelis]MDW4810396.1 hypothetical protein [Shewanella fidelis]MDW4823717.1 hypothetical protein [Shewanella fidelis]